MSFSTFSAVKPSQTTQTGSLDKFISNKMKNPDSQKSDVIYNKMFFITPDGKIIDDNSKEYEKYIKEYNKETHKTKKCDFLKGEYFNFEKMKSQDKKLTHNTGIPSKCGKEYLVKFMNEFVKNTQDKFINSYYTQINKTQENAYLKKLNEYLQKTTISLRRGKGIVNSINKVKQQFMTMKEYNDIVDSIDSTDIEHVSNQLISDSKWTYKRFKNVLKLLHDNYLKEAKESEKLFKLFFEEVVKFNTAYPQANLPLKGDVWNIYKQAQQYLKLADAQKTLDDANGKYQKEYEEYQKCVQQSENTETQEQNCECELDINLDFVKPLIEIVSSFPYQDIENDKENDEENEEVESVE
jgi:hypothetical protein